MPRASLTSTLTSHVAPVRTPSSDCRLPRSWDHSTGVSATSMGSGANSVIVGTAAAPVPCVSHDHGCRGPGPVSSEQTAQRCGPCCLSSPSGTYQARRCPVCPVSQAQCRRPARRGRAALVSNAVSRPATKRPSRIRKGPLTCHFSSGVGFDPAWLPAALSEPRRQSPCTIGPLGADRPRADRVPGQASGSVGSAACALPGW
jgi:hypothetical protein